MSKRQRLQLILFREEKPRKKNAETRKSEKKTRSRIQSVASFTSFFYSPPLAVERKVAGAIGFQSSFYSLPPTTPPDESRVAHAAGISCSSYHIYSPPDWCQPMVLPPARMKKNWYQLFIGAFALLNSHPFEFCSLSALISGKIPSRSFLVRILLGVLISR